MEEGGEEKRLGFRDDPHVPSLRIYDADNSG